MTKVNRGLGKGLDALISGANFVNEQARRRDVSPYLTIADIDVEKVEANPFQPRTEFDSESLEELAQSIKQLGLIQPITVRKIDGDKYQIISGERRFKATRLAGLNTIPAYIRETDDGGMLKMAIVENIQRKDLDPIEVALSFKRLIDECNLTQEEMADIVGKKRSSVTNYLRLLNLPAAIQLALRANKLSVGHAKILSGMDDEKLQLKLANLVIEKGMSVRQLENKLKDMAARKASFREENAEIEAPDDYFKVIEILGKHFNDNVSFKRYPRGTGFITIRFASDKEIKSFLKDLEDKKF
ncbi:MAG: ParB/RepB/Spo0J family partition protein [Bacteroidales bacterium]|jgi:ParB family chromosome partitioning protein|nr:ParB/RepB/Spo0J family partition protein [Bacteroidales bacterium]